MGKSSLSSHFYTAMEDLTLVPTTEPFWKLNARARMPFMYHNERLYILVDDTVSYIYHQVQNNKKIYYPP